MNQAWTLAMLLKHAGDNVFLADMRLGDVLDAHPRLGSQRRRPLAHTITQRHRKLRIVEDADAPGVEKSGHPRGIADHRQRPCDHHAVVA